MEGHSKNCVERYCELANKTTQKLDKVATPCVDDHQFKEEEEEEEKMDQLENYLQFADKLF